MRYFNLETTIHREGECFGFTLTGGSYLRAEPEMLEDAIRYGFNTTTFCNNHTMDFAYDGLIKTLEHVDRSNLVHSGVGRNLDQAAAPGYLALKSGRIAVLGMTSTCNIEYNDVCIAGQQSRRVPGRPGVNQLRFKETLVVTPEQMDQIKAIAAATNVNAQEEIGMKEGYRDPLPEGTFKLGKYVQFRVGEKASKDFTRGLQTDRRMFESVIPRWEMEDGRLTKLELMPIELGFGLPRSQSGLPVRAKDNAILEKLAEISKPYGTEMIIKDGIAEVVL